MIRIAIAEDHTILRDAMVRSLNGQADLRVIIEAGNGSVLLEQMQAGYGVDIILLDLKMPILDGPKTLGKLRSLYGITHKILVLSMIEERSMVLQMLYDGADGYVTKSIGVESLIKAIHTVMDKGFYLSQDISKFSKSNLNGKFKSELNPNEVQILKLICEELTNAQIADLLNLPLGTVRTYRTRMIDKLQVKNTVGLVLYAVKCGFCQLEG